MDLLTLQQSRHQPDIDLTSSLATINTVCFDSCSVANKEPLRLLHTHKTIRRMPMHGPVEEEMISLAW